MNATHRHPAWCSQGRHCDPPRVCNDGTREWVHSTSSIVVPIRDNVCDVFLVRIDSISPDGEHDVCQSIVLSGSGSDPIRSQRKESLRRAPHRTPVCAAAARPLPMRLLAVLHSQPPPSMKFGRYTSTPDEFFVSSTIHPRYFEPGLIVDGNCSDWSRQVNDGPLVRDCSVIPSGPTVANSNGLME